jgi:hypothetical protein
MKPHIQFLIQLYNYGMRPIELIRSWGVPRHSAYDYYKWWRRIRR